MERKLWAVALIVMLIGGGVVLYIFAPEKSNWMPPCVFHALTGLYCPGCGTGRGLHKLLHGDVMGAWRMNSLAVLFLFFLLYAAARYVFFTFTGRKPKPIKLPNWAGWLVVVVIFSFWILRNIPLYPFTLLAPHY